MDTCTSHTHAHMNTQTNTWAHMHPHTCTQTHYKYMHYWWWIGRKDKKGNDKSVFWRQVFRLDLKQETDMECLTESGKQFWFIGQTDAVKGSLPRVVLPKLERGRSEDPDHIHTVKMSRFVNTSSKHNPASTSHKYKAGSQFWTQLSINSSGGSGAGVGGGGAGEEEEEGTAAWSKNKEG